MEVEGLGSAGAGMAMDVDSWSSIGYWDFDLKAFGDGLGSEV